MWMISYHETLLTFLLISLKHFLDDYNSWYTDTNLCRLLQCFLEPFKLFIFLYSKYDIHSYVFQYTGYKTFWPALSWYFVIVGSKVTDSPTVLFVPVQQALLHFLLLFKSAHRSHMSWAHFDFNIQEVVYIHRTNTG